MFDSQKKSRKDPFDLFSLSDIKFGHRNGKMEARIIPDFENYYYDFNNHFRDAVLSERFIIKGRQGTGKTLLGRYIERQASKSPQWSCKMNSLLDYKLQELIILEYVKPTHEEFPQLWRWILLLDCLKLLYHSKDLLSEFSRDKIEHFFGENFVTIDITPSTIISTTLNGSINGRSLVELNSNKEVEFKQEFIQTYLLWLPELEMAVTKLIGESNRRFTLIYDDLDECFREDDIFKLSLIGLSKSTWNLNAYFREKGLNVKFVLIFRSDVISFLNNPSLDKLSFSHAVYMNWGHRLDTGSPLIQMLLHKVRRSTDRFKDQTDFDLFYTLFPQAVNGIDPARFLISHGLFRPRDIIAYIELMLERFSMSQYFGWKSLLDTQPFYTEYFSSELCKEMSGHVPIKDARQSILLVRALKSQYFMFEDIEKEYKRNPELYENIDLFKSMNLLFYFGVIGNHWYDSSTQKYSYNWANHDNKKPLDLSKQLALHVGLRDPDSFVKK
jgi:hypothetical protein